MSMTPPQECPKCRYVRHNEDTAPPWQCPRCGIAYEKFISTPSVSSAARQKIDAPSTFKTEGNHHKRLRVAVLLIILFIVAMDSWLTRVHVTEWNHPLFVVIYPINGDGSKAAAQQITQLTTAQFTDIEQKVKEQAQHYGLQLDDPMDIALAQPVNAIPPLPPRDNNIFKVVWWSLKLRLWASRMDYFDGPTPDVRAFTLYFDPKTHPILEHSTGLEKGMIGVIKLFASDKMSAENNIVMLHELLHTLGATDKYDLHTNQPIYPEGYAEPELQPRHPQKMAEIMAGRIPLSPSHAEIPESLDQVVIGPETAREIGWLK